MAKSTNGTKKLNEALTPDQVSKVEDKYKSIYSGMLKGNKKKLMKYIDPKLKRPNPDAMAMGRAINLVKKETETETINEGLPPGYGKFLVSLQMLITDIAPNAWGNKSQIRRGDLKRIHNSLKKRYGGEYEKFNNLLKTQSGPLGNWYSQETVNESSPELDKIRKEVELIAKNSPGKGWTKKSIDQEINRRLQQFLNRETVNETLKLGVKYQLPTGETGYIMTGGSDDPRNWKFSGNKQPYLSVEDKLTPLENQPGKYDGAFDMGHGKGHHIDEELVNEYINPGYQIETKYFDPNEVKAVADQLQAITDIENIQYKEFKWADGTGGLSFIISSDYRDTGLDYLVRLEHTYDGKWKSKVFATYGAGASEVDFGEVDLNIDMEGFTNMKDITKETFKGVWDKMLRAAAPALKSKRREMEAHQSKSNQSQRDFYKDRGPTSGTIDERLATLVKEVYSEKQRKWACAQDGPEFDEMCKDTAISKKKLKETTMKNDRLTELIKAALTGPVKEESTPIKEGIWSTGTVTQIQNFLRDLNRLKDKYYNIVGSDDVFDGLDRAERSAEEMMMNAPENRSMNEELATTPIKDDIYAIGSRIYKDPYEAISLVATDQTVVVRDFARKDKKFKAAVMDYVKSKGLETSVDRDGLYIDTKPLDFKGMPLMNEKKQRPDYPDIDGDGDTKEPMAKAAKDKEKAEANESFDSLAKKLDKQKGITKDEAAKIAGSIAAKKMKGAGKGPTAKQKKRMAESIFKKLRG
jgi:hypothetical protein